MGRFRFVQKIMSVLVKKPRPLPGRREEKYREAQSVVDRIADPAPSRGCVCAYCCYSRLAAYASRPRRHSASPRPRGVRTVTTPRPLPSSLQPAATIAQWSPLGGG